MVALPGATIALVEAVESGEQLGGPHARAVVFNHDRASLFCLRICRVGNLSLVYKGGLGLQDG